MFWWGRGMVFLFSKSFRFSDVFVVTGARFLIVDGSRCGDVSRAF